MVKIFECKKYQEDVKMIAHLDYSWEKLRDSSILISGATGLIGSFFIDVIAYRNAEMNMNCKVYALSRNCEKAAERFAHCSPKVECFSKDINEKLENGMMSRIDYVVHMASNTHPIAYATEPVNTIITNVLGTKNMLDFALAKEAKRSVFLSSNEIYGENRGDVELFDEKYSGYIDCNTMRAGYPESKRCGESLCQAYMKQYGMDIVIPRVTRSYGPTLLKSDSKALSQFIKKSISGEDIVLKSDGEQYFSYLYVADTVSGIFQVLLEGENGEAYNISDEASDIKLKDLASYIARQSGVRVVFEIPDEVERSGYSTATKARLDSTKLKKLGWKALFTIEEGINHTIEIMKEIEG